ATVPVFHRRLHQNTYAPLAIKAAKSATDTLTQVRCRIRFSLCTAAKLPVCSCTQVKGTTLMVVSSRRGIALRGTVGVRRLGACTETDAMSVGMISEATIVSAQTQRLRPLCRNRVAYSAARAAPLSNSVITRTYTIQVSMEGPSYLVLPSSSLRMRLICSALSFWSDTKRANKSSDESLKSFPSRCFKALFWATCFKRPQHSQHRG